MNIGDLLDSLLLLKHSLFYALRIVYTPQKHLPLMINIVKKKKNHTMKSNLL